MPGIPKVKENDPSGMLHYELEAARDAEQIMKVAIRTIRDTIVDNGIKDARTINAVVEGVMSETNAALQKKGLTWIDDSSAKAIIHTNIMIGKMGHVSSMLGPYGLPQHITDNIAVVVAQDLRSLTSDISKKLVRDLVDGMNSGLGPKQIARNIRDSTDMEVARARTIARTTVMEVSNKTAYEDYRRAGARGYVVYPTSDERLCEKCMSIAFIPGTHRLKEYTDYPSLPVHPNCRCALIGVFDDTDSEIYLSATPTPMIMFEGVAYADKC